MAALAQVATPHPNHFGAEPPKGPAVGRDSEVRKIPADDAAEPLTLFVDGVMPPTSQHLLHGLECCTYPLWVAATGQQEVTSSRRPTGVEKAKETKRLRRTALSSLRPRRPRVASEFDEARLVGVQFESESAQSFAQLVPKPLRIVLVLKAHHEVVSVSRDDNVTVRMPASPLMGPGIQGIV